MNKTELGNMLYNIAKPEKTAQIIHSDEEIDKKNNLKEQLDKLEIEIKRAQDVVDCMDNLRMTLLTQLEEW